jgi:dihydrofolate synthase/folylpolyglutamate synthase
LGPGSRPRDPAIWSRSIASTPDPRRELFALEHIGIKLGLDQIRGLVAALDHPDRAFRAIVVAGTNGKGSVTAMVERGLRAAGYRTGRYTSPHLVNLEERFAIDGTAIRPDQLEHTAARVLEAGRQLPAPPSFFEATTALALDVFRDARIDIAVLEVGLGGRLDATNVVTPVAVAITSIDFDHEQYLGSTLDAIAAEKAGVIKPACDVVLSDNPAVVVDVVERRCRETGAHLVRAREGVDLIASEIDGRTRIGLTTPVREYGSLTLGLRGAHQVTNAVTAIRLMETLALGSSGLNIDERAIRTGVEDVVWPGRLELVRSGIGEVLIDGAHNPAGARALAAYVQCAYGRPLPMVVGVMRDKKIDEVLTSLAPAAARFFFTTPATARAATPEELAHVAGRVAPSVAREAVPDPLEAVRIASSHGNPVVVAGSLYLAGEIRSRLS